MANFNDIIGQAQVKEHLQQAILNNNISHAYILNGETGSGRHMLADCFAKALLCTNRNRANACDICTSCHQADSHNHPDIHYIVHEKATIGVDEIRTQVNNDVVIKPYSGSHKVYIIPEANKMTEAAQNALLKTIEEPPAYVVILLLTDNVDMLLPTIQSRCIRLNTEPLRREDIAGYLVKNLSMEPEQANIAAGFCQGNMGRAIRFATSEDFLEMKEDTLRLLKNVDKLRLDEIMDTIHIFSEKKGMIKDYLDLMLLWYRDVLMFKVTKDTNLLLYQNEYRDISYQATTRTYEDLEKILDAIQKAKQRLDANVNFEVAIELMVLTMKD